MPSSSPLSEKLEPVRHAPMVVRDRAGDWKPGCSCGWKISDGWWTRKSAELRTLTHCERVRDGLAA